MEERQIQDLLLKILNSALNEEKAEVLIDTNAVSECLEPLYRLAKRHDVAYAVSQFVYKNKISGAPEVMQKLQMEELVTVYRAEQFSFTLDEICQAFDEENIAYLPLKGAVIRSRYPSEYLRTSCDIDVLIHEEDIDKATACLVKKGYTCGEREYHDVSLYSPSKVHLELHFTLFENLPALDKVLGEVWRYAKHIEKGRHELLDEFFAYHIFAHMAYHFSSGGCGIRSLMDIWVMEHKMGLDYTCAEKLLEKAGIYKFAEQMSAIANKCFGNGDVDEFSKRVLGYIFDGGLYGTEKNKIAVNKSKADGIVTYAIRRLFMPYRYMADAYPVLVKAPFLLPIFWVVRGFRVIFNKDSKRIISELNYANNMSEGSISDMKEICAKLGL